MADKNMEAQISVEFEEATSRQSLNSGETINTLWGKVKRWLSDLKAVAFSGSYNDLSDKPTIPTVGNGTVTIKQGGTNKGSFTMNQSGNTTIELDVVDNLISTDTTKSLSANQGKVLKDLVDGKATKSHTHSDYALKSKYGNTFISLGRKPDTTVGGYSIAEGQLTTASGMGSHAEGGYTTASEDGAHAEGWLSTASGHNAHAEGYNTTASGDSSHTEGRDTIASGNYSHAGGYYTNALNDYEVAYGTYNQSNSDTLFSVGDGTADDARHNAIEITKTGGKLHDKDIATTDLIPTTLPANGGNADTVNNHTVESDVPANALFTDTVYDDTEIDNRVKKNTDDISQLFDVSKGGEAATGNSSYTIENTVDYPIMGINVYGKSIQGGTPTPENPVDIVSVGDSGSIEVETCGKNLFDLSKCNWKTKEFNGLSFTRNDNGEILVNGTATAATTVIFTSNSMQGKITSGQLILSGCPQTNVGGGTCRLQFYYNSPTLGSKQIWQSNSVEATITLPSDYTDYNCSIFINSGFTANNLVFKPMLRSATITDSTFEPYKGNTASITSSLPLCGIPVSRGGNYTDSNGQQWVCDELIYNADGTGKIIKRTQKIIFDGSDDEGWATSQTQTSGKNRIITKSIKSNVFKPQDAANMPRVICDNYSANSATNTYFNINGISIDTAGSLIIYDDERSALSAAEWKSSFAANPITVVYQFAEPQEIELTAAEMTALRQLQTFNGTTSMSNSSGAEMSVKYCTNKALSESAYPITMGLQKQIDELRAAILSMGGNV